MVDADNFKEINTRFGHITGDFVLAEIAAILTASMRGSDAAIRYGGDEFLLLLPDISADGAQHVVDRIAKRIDDWNKADNLQGFHLDLSVGAVEWHDGQTLNEVLDKADQKMYEQKNYTTADLFRPRSHAHLQMSNK